ncbi:DUF2690 domain-containing protein [Streptacidiphilus sp. EB129]|uniref:helix-turn-helix domain-containing protein n=1 Tax=Streptacidiphilus sp. EB129 TaxID=3156262 RepID=UPI0035185B9C
MNSAWKPLPENLSGAARRLTEQLRAVKDAHGLSLADLASRTHFSKASWERWLNGKRLITEQALAGLVSTVDCDAVLLNALLAQAQAEQNEQSEARPADARQNGTAEPAAPPEPESRSGISLVDAGSPDHVPAPRALPRVPRPALWGSAAAVLALALCGVWLVVSGHPAGSAARTASGPTTVATPTPFCQGIGCAGKDPQSTGCGSDVTTLTTSNVGKVIIYVHYSARCKAAWAAITTGAKGDTATITSSTGDTETALIHWGYDNYSAMVDASNPSTTFRVCGVQPAGHGCTDVVTVPAKAATAPPPAAHS